MFDDIKQKIKKLAVNVGIPIAGVTLVVGGLIGGLIESGDNAVSASAASAEDGYSDYSDDTTTGNGGTYSGNTFKNEGKTYKLFSQGDYSYPFGEGETISSAGCGVTSIAIVVSGFKDGEDPVSIVQHCRETKGYDYTYANNNVINSYLGEYGLKGIRKEWDSNAPKEIEEHLKKGLPVIYNVHGTMVLDSGAQNNYSQYGHFLTLLGIDKKGKIFVGDPFGEDGYTSMQNVENALGGYGGYGGYYLVEKIN